MFKMIFTCLLLCNVLVFSQYRSCTECERAQRECEDDLGAAIKGGSAFFSIMSRCQRIQQRCLDLCRKERDEQLYGEQRRKNEQQRNRTLQDMSNLNDRLQNKSDMSERELRLYNILKQIFDVNYNKLSKQCQEATKLPSVPYYDMYGMYDSYATMLNDQSWKIDFRAVGMCLSNIVESYADNFDRFQQIVEMTNIPKKDWETAKTCIRRIAQEYLTGCYKTQQMLPF